MTVSATTTTKSYTGDGSTTSFPTTFAFQGTGSSAELTVVQRTIATGAETTLSYSTHFTVTGGNGSTGTVVAASAPADTVQWHIRRNTTTTQTSNYVTNDPFPADTLEGDIDRLAMAGQERDGDISQTFKFPDTYTGGASTTMPEPIANAYLLFNSDGDAITTSTTSASQYLGSDGTVSAPFYSFSADANSGFYRIGSDNVGLSLGGTKRVDFGTATTAFTGQVTATGFTGTLDGILGSGSPAAATVASLTSGGNIVSDTDSTDDLGTNSVRWANLYVDAVTTTDNTTIGGNLTVTGNLTINGTTVTNDATNTEVKDPLIELNSGAGSNANDLGIIMERGSTGDNAFIGWDESGDHFALGTTTATASSTGNISYTSADLVLGTVTAEGDTSAGDKATMGYTAAEGLILTGQGSSYDFVLKNDADGDVARVATGTTVLEVPGSIKLATGATVTGILDEDDMSTNSATQIATQQSIKAYVDSSSKAPGISMTWESDTTDSDAGNGKVWANHATLSSATVLYFDDVENNGVSINDLIDSLDDPTAGDSAMIYIQEAGTGSAGAVFAVSGAVTDASGYSKVAVTHKATFGTLADGDTIGVVFAFSGNNGAGSGDLLASNNLSDVASATTSRTNLGVGTGDSPQFTGVNVGHASDTTLTRASAGDLAVEGNAIYRAGGTDVPVADGGTGASSLTDGGILLGSGTDAITAMDALAKGSIVVGDGATDPVALAVGSNNHVLTADSSEASGLKWAAAASGGYELLSATTCSSTASVALESMEAGYHYRLIGSNLIPASNNQDLYVQIGTSGPSYATSGYQYIVGGYLGTSHTKEASTSASQFRVIGQGGGTATGEQLFCDIQILNPALATARTHLYGNVGGKEQGGNMIEQNFVGFRSTAEANVAVKIYFAGSNIASGTVYFYRIADA